MNIIGDLSSFFNPGSVALIGASNSFGTWGNMVLRGLISQNESRKIYPINPRDPEILGIHAYPSLTEVPGEVELAIIAIPAEKLDVALTDCARKGVKGVVIITSGFSEARGHTGREEERNLALFGKRSGFRVLGPNISGVFNLHDNFIASSANPVFLTKSNISFICQGGYGPLNIIAKGHFKGFGVGKFIHTGNEADLECTDFLKVLGDDPDTEVILMYVEWLKDPRRFLQIAREITEKKPVIIFKGGDSGDGARAAASHTGAMAGSSQIYHGLFQQAGCIQAMDFESMLEMGNAFTFYPGLKGPRIGIMTWGGSWGVMLVDNLCSKGLQVPEFPVGLQQRLRDIGMPYRASVKNPVDVGAAGISLDMDAWVSIVDALLSTESIDGLVVHGLGRIGVDFNALPDQMRDFQKVEEAFLRKTVEIMRTYEKPLVIGSVMSHHESLTVRNLLRDGILCFTRLADISNLLSMLLRFHQRRIGGQALTA